MLAILVTLMFYQVGFAQYHMVLFVLASYWMVRAHGSHGARCSGSGSREPAISAGFRYFNVLLATIDIDGTTYANMDWFADDFLLGCLLAASIVRSPAVTRKEPASPGEPVSGMMSAVNHPAKRRGQAA